MLGRIQIQADDVLQFLGETGIVAQLKSFHAVRLQTVTVPDAPYTGLADTGHGGHSASAPVGCMRRSFLCRLITHARVPVRWKACGQVAERRAPARRYRHAENASASEQQCAARSKAGGQSSGPACLRRPATQSGRAAQPGPEHCARAHRSLALLFARWSELPGVRFASAVSSYSARTQRN